uniref:Minichromosome maintenance 10 replication initiation factor n=1 Tax=Cyprinus carpio TaxID=7962 RepID=A0A8C2GQ72_CYPCA
MCLTSEEENLDMLLSLFAESESQEQVTPDAGEGSDNLDDLFDEDDDGDPYIEPEEEGEDDAAPGNSSSAEVDSDLNKSKEDLEAELKLMQEKMQKLQQQLEASQKTTQPENKPSVQRQTSTKSLTTPRGGSKTPPPTGRDSDGSPPSDVTAKLKSKQRTAHHTKAATSVRQTSTGQSMINCPSQPVRDAAKVNHTLKSPLSLKTPPAVCQATPRPSVSQEVAVEKFSGLRLRKPRLSSIDIEQKMASRRLIKLSQLPDRLARDNLEDSDWVTFAVVINKITPQSKNNGKTFSIWKLNDLHNLEVNVSLFLFGSVHTDLWKTDTGTVIGVLNPNPMKNKDGSSEVLSHYGSKMLKEFNVIFEINSSFSSAVLQKLFLHVVLNSGEVSGCSDDFKGLISMPTPGALNIKKHLGQAKNTAVAGSSVQSISASDLLKQQKEELQQRMLARKKRAEEIQKRVLQSSAPSRPNVSRGSLLSPKAASQVPKGSPGFTSCLSGPPVPTLGRGFSEGEDILLDTSPPSSKSLSAAKLAAMRKLKAKGSVIVKDDPNAVKRKRANGDDITERVERNLSTPTDENSTGEEEEPAQKKRREQLDYIQSEEFQRILNAKSSNSWMMGEIEERAMQEYFEPLVQKEKMEEKMRSIREMKCRAVTCKTCKYTHFKPADRCVEEKHDYQWHDAVKRFFKCPCGQRKICLGRMPHGACSHCGLFKWERDGMLKEKKGPKIGGELLLPCGEEQPKFLSSLK